MTRPDTLDEHFVNLDAKLGVALLDYDLDGRQDIFTGNARAEPDVNRFEHGRDFDATPEVLWNRGNGWIEAINGSGEGLARVAGVRGIAAADLDGDGDSDIVLVQNSGAPRLLRNDQREPFPWLQLDLVATGSSRDAGGARVEVHTPSHVLVQTMVPAMGYMAQSSSTLTFGLGGDARVRKVVVYWPSGRRSEVRPEGMNRRMVVKEE
jgi:hypothetical protein